VAAGYGRLGRPLDFAGLVRTARRISQLPFRPHLRIDCLPEHYPQHPERNIEHYLTQIVGIEDEQKPA
jgi:hypothetical protein